MSWNAPAPIAISRTAASDPFRRLKKFLNVNCAEPVVTAICGVSSLISAVQLGPLDPAELGAEVARIEVVAHAVGDTHVGAITEVTHPPGRAGSATPSKFSENDVVGESGEFVVAGELDDDAPFAPPSLKARFVLPRSAAPSWSFTTAAKLPSQGIPGVTVNVPHAAGPPAFNTPKPC